MINLLVPGRIMSQTGKPGAPHWNAFPEAAGLELTVPQGARAGEALGLNAELVFGQQPLSGQGVSFRLGVKTGFLRVELDGCEVIPGTRFAMRDQPATVHREVRREETEIDTTNAAGSAAAKLALGPKSVAGEAEIGGAASGSRERERRAFFRQEGVEELHKVTARGTNTEPSWEIRDPENPILDGRYLGVENLCEVEPQGDCYQIIAQFVCRKRDLALTEVECSVWRSIAKEKLALAVVAKELGKTVEGLEEGMLGLSRSRLASAGGEGRADDER